MSIGPLLMGLQLKGEITAYIPTGTRRVAQRRLFLTTDAVMSSMIRIPL